MRIKYVEQATVRILEPNRWDAENGYTVDVIDPDDALHLLTHSPGDFKVAPDEPLLTLSGMDEAKAGELVLHRITTIGALGALGEGQAAELATAMGVDGEQVHTWVAEARAWARQAPAAASEVAAAIVQTQDLAPVPSAKPAEGIYFASVPVVALESERAGATPAPTG